MIKVTPEQIRMFTSDIRWADKGLLKFLYTLLKQNPREEERNIFKRLIHDEIKRRVIRPKGELP